METRERVWSIHIHKKSKRFRAKVIKIGNVFSNTRPRQRKLASQGYYQASQANFTYAPPLSKLAEEFIVQEYVAPAILSIIYPVQFGGIPRSSSTFALISMVNCWEKATDAWDR